MPQLSLLLKLPQRRSLEVIAFKRLQILIPQSAQLSSYAPPLEPMRERDIKALAELFRQEKIEEIEADIGYNLLRRIPEPGWDDGFDL